VHGSVVGDKQKIDKDLLDSVMDAGESAKAS
jgi:hypothetical protein